LPLGVIEPGKNCASKAR